ncbi:MAG: hypothetical protein JWP35_2310 [Caulobacter sp.]|nr:hypothetical protein [Caulobacter sp.]
MNRSDDPRNLPVPVTPAVTEEAGHVGGPAGRRSEHRKAGDPSFEAHLMGQPGAKRGLRGGPETLQTARSAYLEAEYSGPADRRPKPGILRKTEI